MGRYKPDRTVHADWWDEEEHATFRGNLGFLAAQRIAYHVAASQEITPASDDDVVRMVEHMAAALVDALVPPSQTLKDREGQPPAWTVAGPDGSVVPLTTDGIAGMLPEDIAYLFKEAFPRDPSMVVVDGGTPAEHVEYQPEGMITPAAQEAGLTPEVFPTTPN